MQYNIILNIKFIYIGNMLYKQGSHIVNLHSKRLIYSIILLWNDCDLVTLTIHLFNVRTEIM